jgi:hypothetical protein
MFFWIYDIPTTTLALYFAVVFIGGTWAAIFLVSPILRFLVKSQEGINDFVGYALGAFGVFYGLLLGLLAVSSYENTSELDGIVASEAAALAGLWRDVDNYPEPVRTNLQGKLRIYTANLVDGEWPAQRRGTMDPAGVKLASSFQKDLCLFNPGNASQEILHAETMRAFNTMVEFRSKRIQNTNSGIPPVMWWVVMIGAVVNTLIITFFKVRFDVHLIIGGLLALVVGSLIFVIAVLDYPFRGEVSIGPDRIKVVYDALMKSSAPATPAPTGP